ncbi:MAG: glycosyltransferase family 2 protein [Candidatus Beckwithbacteria bacterium]
MNPVSIVIPNFKKLPLIKHLPVVIKACLPRQQAGPQAEIIVVDDASPDDTIAYLQQNFPQVKILVNPTNQRFAFSCNQGIKAAKNNLVVLLNSDVAPQPGFLKPLLSHFQDPQVFAVSCLEIQTDLNGQKTYSGHNQCWFERGLLLHQKKPIKNFKTTAPNCWASGGSMALDRNKYLKLGGMDVLFKPAYWEDIDLSWRAREQFGYKVLFEPRSQVYHNHETTNTAVFGEPMMETMALRNQLLFVWKNIKGKKLLLHFLWLPYHLIFTSLRTQGRFLIAFLQALVKWLKYKLCKH